MPVSFSLCKSFRLCFCILVLFIILCFVKCTYWKNIRASAGARKFFFFFKETLMGRNQYPFNGLDRFVFSAFRIYHPRLEWYYGFVLVFILSRQGLLFDERRFGIFRSTPILNVERHFGIFRSTPNLNVKIRSGYKVLFWSFYCSRHAISHFSYESCCIQ